MTPRLILVTGGTGKQGSSFIRSILQAEPEASSAPQHFRVWTLTRNIKSPAAKKLVERENVHVVEGDLDNPDSVRKVFEDAKAEGGFWGIFCVLAFPGLGVSDESEQKQGKLVADLALEYGVANFVYSSAELGSGDTAHHHAKAAIEKHIKDLGSKGLSWTILRPGFFMENYEGMIGRITTSVLKAGLKPTTKILLIAAEDIGRVAAAVFQTPDPFRFKTLVLAGDHLTMQEQMDFFESGTGQAMPTIPNLFARVLISRNKATREVVESIEKQHRAREAGETPDLESQLALTAAAYPNLLTFEGWSKSQTSAEKKDSQSAGNWNQVSIARLIRGKQ